MEGMGFEPTTSGQQRLLSYRRKMQHNMKLVTI